METNAKPTKYHKVKFGSFEIKLLPIDTPLEEYLQAISVASNIFMIICGITVAPLFLAYLFFYTRFWFLVPLYIAWIYYDREAGFKGGRKWNWFRRLAIFRYFRDYFPSNLIKTADLPANANYLFISYPHGVISYNTLSCFGSEANKIESEVYPGIDFHFVTLDINFHSPFTREYFMSLGGIGAKESSIEYVLNSKPSKAVVLIAGGAAEAQYVAPGSIYQIITSRRKGFVRLALKTGVSLVPVFSFGESNLYTQYKSKRISAFQETFKKYTGIYPVFLRGRGVFQLSFGLLPNKQPINTVVGKPIAVPKIENPSKEVIEEYHAKFVQELKALFEEYKHKYDEAGSEAKLITL